jgi:hypothetical protein
MRGSSRSTKVLAAGVVALAVPASVLLAGSVGAQTGPVVASGPQLTTIFSGATLGLTQPDDLVTMGGQIFVGFQNGVGPQGQPSSTGGLDGTVVEMTTTGVIEGTWNLQGKIDGMAADPQAHQILATVNEDLNSSLFTIDPTSTTPVEYTYSPSPLPHSGGTDSLSVSHGQIFVAASAPGTAPGSPPPPQPSYPAVYSLALDTASHVATATAIFSDEATAVIANAGSTSGHTTTLGLTDPDSTAVVPLQAARFGGDFVLGSQGDQQQIYVHGPGSSSRVLNVLSLSQSVDDTAWATTTTGALFMTDHANNLVDVLRTHYNPGTAYVAVTPCNANSAPPTCTTPNYLGTVNLYTGAVNPVNLGAEMVQPVGLTFLGSTGG